MHSDSNVSLRVAAASSPRRPWVAPVLAMLPSLTALTLLSGAPIDGTGGPGGVTFSLLKGRGPFRVG
jgi:hypothetical protein